MKQANFVPSISGAEGKHLISGNLSGLRNDDIFPTNSKVSLSALTNLPCRKGLESAIISGGMIVNTVSDSYGHLPNEQYFLQVEEKLINSEIQYAKRSINRDNRSFACDYILNDDSFKIDIHAKSNKSGGAPDAIRPMLRFVNSYDGSNKTSGYFGFYREVCKNGLHVSEMKVGFSIKHRGSIVELVMPEIHNLVNIFMNNEYYTICRKFEVLAEKPITDIGNFVRMTCKELALFQYHASEKNPAPSLNARLVEDTISREANLLGCNANYWLGYNAFNEVIHDKLKKSFELQKTQDSKLFAYLAS